MKINITGLRGREAQKLEDAARFYSKILLHPRTASRIYLDLVISADFEDAGECINEDDIRSPSYFTINLKLCEEDLASILAHEMVHLKQHATNEIRKVFVMHKSKKGESKRRLLPKWKGKVWEPKHNEDPYFDSPWEIEAFGREVGLYHRWLESQDNS